MIQSSHPLLVCLQESKFEEISDSLGKEFLGQRLSNFSFLPATGVRGGIVLAWDDDYIGDFDLIWDSIGRWLGCSSLLPEHWKQHSTIDDWFLELAGKGNDGATKGVCTLAILVIWAIWCERNAEKSVQRIVEEINDTARLWGNAGAEHLAALVVVISSE
ncbi:hypothetical protein HU200_067175 [Digitaria exilis]|uniref:Uncharacterized protein n=1 Tax=Digitaria exilis TaxID=1010633 RepID=A0A835A0L2_9POAL|nr:hypothetical protein HU200_067175 [Digitaria exilis]